MRVLLCGVLLAACEAAPRAAPPEPPPPAAPALAANPDSLRDDLVRHGLLLPPDDRAAVMARLGPPDSVRSTPVANRHDPARTDSTVTFFYPGAHLEYYVVSAGGELSTSISVLDNRHLKYPRLGVGAAASAVLAALGEPSARADGALTYQCRSCQGAENPVLFHLAGDTVRRVEFQYYVD